MMIEICGWFGYPVSEAWELTPREFEVLTSGFMRRQRADRGNFALIASLICRVGGGADIPPEAFVDPNAEYGEVPFSKTTDDEARERQALFDKQRQELDARAEKAQREWLREVRSAIGVGVGSDEG